jgi:ketosteroid isomerase-like protein
MGGVEDPAANVLSRYRTAVSNKDVDGVMALYADDVLVFDGWSVWAYEGAAAWRQAVENWLGSLGGETVTVGWEDVRTEVGADLTVVTAIATYAAISPNGEQLRSLQNHMTCALARRGGVWKIVHEHSSSPIGPKDLKAILRRAPEG